MKVWKRNAVVAAVVLFVCAAVYLNWTYQSGETADAGKTLGEAALVNGQTDDPLLSSTASPAPEASATPAPSGGGYFDSARLNRQQARDSALTILEDAMASENADEAMKEANGQAIQTIAGYTVSEAQIENLVTAKGYADCVAFIGENALSLAVAAPEGGLTDTDTARIVDVVHQTTGFTADQVKIISVDPQA